MVQITNKSNAPRSFNVGRDEEGRSKGQVTILPGETQDIDLHDPLHPTVIGAVNAKHIHAPDLEKHYDSIRGRRRDDGLTDAERAEFEAFREEQRRMREQATGHHEGKFNPLAVDVLDSEGHAKRRAERATPEAIEKANRGPETPPQLQTDESLDEEARTQRAAVAEQASGEPAAAEEDTEEKRSRRRRSE